MHLVRRDQASTELPKLQAPRLRPLRELRTDNFLISRFEVTYADWLEYLTALPEAARQKHLDSQAVLSAGQASLKQLSFG